MFIQNKKKVVFDQSYTCLGHKQSLTQIGSSDVHFIWWYINDDYWRHAFLLLFQMMKSWFLRSPVGHIEEQLANVESKIKRNRFIKCTHLRGCCACYFCWHSCLFHSQHPNSRVILKNGRVPRRFRRMRQGQVVTKCQRMATTTICKNNIRDQM